MTAEASSLPSVCVGAVPAVSAPEMAEIDRLAVDEFGISLPQMLEQAGSHLAEVARLELGGDLTDKLVVVAAGPGNNGAGGLVAARHLRNRGALVRVILARPVARLGAPAREQVATLLAMAVSCCVPAYDVTDEELEAMLAKADLVVDALLGYGVAGAPRGEVARQIASIRRSGSRVLSLDVPSGVDPDTGETPGLALAADATVTVALPKLGLLLKDGRDRSGRLYVADIGLPAELYRRVGIDVDPVFSAARIVRIESEA